MKLLKKISPTCLWSRSNDKTKATNAHAMGLFPRGFALIATVSIMSLLVLLAVATMSMSAVEVRSTSGIKHIEQARANARMALMFAIAELQELTGPDTRITAPADAYSGVRTSQHVRQLTGVWRSWEGLNHDTTTGRPVAPDYGIKEQAFANGGRFLGWMISDKSQSLTDPKSPPSIEWTANTVPLLASGTLPGGTDLEVHVEPTDISDKNGDGAYAWWIQGENTKVRLKPVLEANSSKEAVEQITLSPGPSGKGVEIDDTTNTNKAITQNSLALVEGDVLAGTTARESFHDVSVHSRGLVTNNANGGFKRDLSLFSENLSSVNDGFSSFTLSPGNNVWESSKSNFSSSNTHPLIYPWVTTWVQNSSFPDCVSWTALANYTSNYKKLTTSGSAITKVAGGGDQHKERWVEDIRPFPVVARIHFVISLTANENTTSGQFTPAVLINPVVTMWNPYSSSIDMSGYPNMFLTLNDAACPITFDFKVGDNSKISADLAKITTINKNNSDGLVTRIPLNSPTTWLPGEVRVFSPTGSVDVGTGRNDRVQFAAGYRPASGLRYVLQGSSATSGATTYSV